MAIFSTLIFFLSEEINNAIHAKPTAEQPTAKDPCNECAGFPVRDIGKI